MGSTDLVKVAIALKLKLNSFYKSTKNQKFDNGKYFAFSALSKTLCQYA